MFKSYTNRYLDKLCNSISMNRTKVLVGKGRVIPYTYMDYDKWLIKYNRLFKFKKTVAKLFRSK